MEKETQLSAEVILNHKIMNVTILSRSGESQRVMAGLKHYINDAFYS
jgi:hypothetical protein